MSSNHTTPTFDLLSLVEYGGCSAKIPQGKLTELLSSIPLLQDEKILVGLQTHDDAGVYRLNDETALIVTTDFFPPICSDPTEFGEIAATNSLSDVYAMGGTPLLTLNINLFPSQQLPLEVLRDILLGGQQKINEAGAFTMGGHTIEDPTPKYGLAVVGTVHPDRLVTNGSARAGDLLILTKPLGTGVLVAAQRLKICSEAAYRQAVDSMKLLNKTGGELMQKHGVRAATDITGFGLLGHLKEMALASGVSMQIDAERVPLFDGVEELIDDGCIPGGAIRNLESVEPRCHFSASLTTPRKMALCDPQTSGGLLIAIRPEAAEALLADLHASGIHPHAAIIGEVQPRRNKELYIL